MMRKRISALMLVGALAASVLAGCGNNNTEKEPANTENRPGTGTGTEAQPQGSENLGGAENPGGTESLDGTEATGQSTEEQEPMYPPITSDEAVEDFGSVVIVGNAAYELYTYVDEPADNYAQAINKVAENLAGSAQVYDIVIPLGSEIIFPDNLRGQLNSSNQREAMLNIQGKMSAGVRSVDIYDSLMTHRNEYIYFRTDHHWTALGAYYAYTDFCAAKEIEPEALDGYETMEFDGFLGSFYFNDTDENPKLGESPDLITAYLPHMDAIMHIVDSRDVAYDSKVIYDETNAAASLKYSCFIAGDNPYTEIVNNELTDGSSCIVVKESFGNAFTPFLVDHYQTIYVVDYRYWTGSVSELAAEKGVEDIIFINNLSMIRNKNLVGKLYRII